MKKIRGGRLCAREAIFYVLAFFTTCAIFFFSAQSGEESGEMSRSVLSVLLELLPAGLIPQEDAHLLLRKLAHFGIFFIDGLFLALAMGVRRTETRKMHAVRLLILLLIAALSEIRQIFAVGRGPSAWDVAIDFAGALSGSLSARALCAVHRRKKNEF